MSVRPLPPVTRAIKWVVRPALMLVTKRDWQGVENLPTSGGFIIAVNHISYADPILISHWMVDHNIAPRFLAKDTLFRVPLLGWIVRKTEQIPVRRSAGAAAESLDPAARAIAAGQVITVYPEGTITRDPNAWPMSARTGAIRLALTTGAPLVPVMQWGPQDIMWPYRKLPRLIPRKTIHVRVGKPLDLSGLADQELNEEGLRKVADELMDQITQMQAEVRGELPHAERIDVRSLPARRNGTPGTAKELDS